MSADKRLPGESNADYERCQDPNADFIGTQSLYGGGDPSFLYRLTRAFFVWRDRRRAARP